MNDFRDGILSLNTRQFGNVVEILIRFINKQKYSKVMLFDSFDIDNKKIEIKASRVYKKNVLKLNEKNLYDLITSNSNKNRLIKQSSITKNKFDCNIQQIKTELFDELFYVLFFYDLVEMFKISKENILNDENIYYCNKQHRGNIGEGQFHINNKSYSYHKEKYFECSFTYDKLKNLLLLNK